MYTVNSLSAIGCAARLCCSFVSSVVACFAPDMLCTMYSSIGIIPLGRSACLPVCLSAGLPVGLSVCCLLSAGLHCLTLSYPVIVARVRAT